jgi:antitoxin MazE
MAKSAKLTVQQWGNSLAVRVPAAVARSAHFTVGQSVEVSVSDEGVVVRRSGKPRLTLAQKLAAFDPAKQSGDDLSPWQGGDVMPTRSRWIPQRCEMIWIDCNPQADREMRDVPPLDGTFACRIQ